MKVMTSVERQRSIRLRSLLIEIKEEMMTLCTLLEAHLEGTSLGLIRAIVQVKLLIVEVYLVRELTILHLFLYLSLSLCVRLDGYDEDEGDETSDEENSISAEDCTTPKKTATKRAREVPSNFSRNWNFKVCMFYNYAHLHDI